MRVTIRVEETHNWPEIELISDDRMQASYEWSELDHAIENLLAVLRKACADDPPPF